MPSARNLTLRSDFLRFDDSGEDMTFKNDLIRIINNSQQNTWSRFRHVQNRAAAFGLDAESVGKWKSPGEPALVYGLVDDCALHRIADSIQRHLISPLGRASAIISPIFIHQKPKVRFNVSDEVEIGDLLLIRQHFQTGRANSQGKALLIQAKVAGKPRTGLLKGNELVQFNLYNGWRSPFSFPYKEVTGRARWDFGSNVPSHLAETGVYAIGYKHEKLSNKGFSFPDNCAWAVGKVPYPVNTPRIDASGQSLATVVDDFVRGRYGRPWSPANAGDDDHWSDFVIQMLAVSSGWSAPLQRIGKTRVERRRPDILMFLEAMPVLAMAVHSTEYRVLRYEERESYLERKLADLRNWMAGSGGEPPELPMNTHRFYPRENKGISVLYVGTFGDQPLGEEK